MAPSRIKISTAPCCTKKPKICALEQNQAAKKLIISSCTPTMSALLLYTTYYCCIACTYCQQCCDTTVHSTVVPPLLYVYVPTHKTLAAMACTYRQYYNNGDDLLNMGRQQRVPRQRRWPSLETPGRPGCGVALRTSYTRVALQSHGGS